MYSLKAIDLEKLQQLCNAKNIVLTEHALQRLVECKISIQDILQAIMTGKIIKQYEDDKPFASCLVLGITINQKPLHLVISHDEEFIYLITAYYPNPTQWEADWETRKQ